MLSAKEKENGSRGQPSHQFCWAYAYISLEERCTITPSRTFVICNRGFITMCCSCRSFLCSFTLVTSVGLVLSVFAERDALPSASEPPEYVNQPSIRAVFQIAGSSDDAEEIVSSGQVNLGSLDLELGHDVRRRGIVSQVVGIRFPSVLIPRDANVLNAYIQFTADDKSASSALLRIRGEASSYPAPFAEEVKNISSRSPTVASLEWKVPKWGTRGHAGGKQRTPSLAHVIEEIVSLPDWSNGNPLVLIVEGRGERTAVSWNGDPSLAPELHVQYVPSKRQPFEFINNRRGIRWRPGQQIPLYFVEYQNRKEARVGDWFPDNEAIANIEIKENGRWSEIFETYKLNVEDVVVIPEGVEVMYDAHSEQVFRAVVLRGGLTFDPHTSTRLTVGTIHVEDTGRLTIRNANEETVSEVIFSGTVNKSEDPNQMNLGLLAVGGATDIEGADVETPWTKLVEPVSAGTKRLVVEDALGWRAGDELYLADTSRGDKLTWRNEHESETERVRIGSVQGSNVLLDREVRFAHDGYVANPRRNIVMRSDFDDVFDTRGGSGEKLARRAHIFFGGHARATVKHALLYGLGRTSVEVRDDTRIINGEKIVYIGRNPRARHALHAHHMHEPAYWEGNAIVSSPRIGIALHNSIAYVYENTVIGSAGSGIFAECSIEFGEIVRNLVMGMGGGTGETDDDRFAKFNGEDLGFGGFGYWFRGPFMTVEQNLAVGYFKGAAYHYYSHPGFVSQLVVPDIEGVPEELIGRTVGNVLIADTPIQAYGSFDGNRAEGVFRTGLRVSYRQAGDDFKNFTVLCYARNSRAFVATHGGKRILTNPTFVGGGEGEGIGIHSGNKVVVEVYGGSIENFAVGYRVQRGGGTLSGTYLDNDQNVIVGVESSALNAHTLLDDLMFGDTQENVVFTSPVRNHPLTLVNYQGTGRNYTLTADEHSPPAARTLFGIVNGKAEEID